MNMERLQSGDQVFHPMYGVGVILGLATHERNGQPSDYYTVHIADGATLSVPVERAEALGLRLLVNSLARIIACLHSPAAPLPDDDRLRVGVLNSRWKAPQAAVVTETVRDLLPRRLTPDDKHWL